MTREEIRTRILEGLNESASDPSFWSKAEVDDVIQEAMEVVAEEAQSIKHSTIVPIRPGATYYHTESIADEMVIPYRVWLHHDNRKLEATTIWNLDREHQRWVDVTGDPWNWFPVSWDLFGVWPRATEGGKTLRVDYFTWPRTLVDDDMEPEVPGSDHDTFVLYGIYDGLLKQWDFERAIAMFGQFMERLATYRPRASLELQGTTWARTPERYNGGRFGRA